MLVDHVANRWRRLREILSAVQAVEPGKRFTAAGAQWQRTAGTYDLKRAKTEKRSLRHAGLRIEELCM
ncbi:hypothetical protein [Streptomyces sp. NPDC004267]|uniref:hypothetical protein n=1 Tax=Streptomyces sp. NPDC004267 TaxID=3364694 RepID=UPI00367498A2